MAEVGCFFGLVLPPCGAVLRLASGAAYGALLAFTLACGVATSRIDPVDRGIHRLCKESKKSKDQQAVVPAADNPSVVHGERVYCYICQAHVGLGSAHCRFCNKCVESFDHHCKWLNNCVGGPNYRLFLATLAGALAMSLMQGAISLMHLVAFAQHRARFAGSVASFAPALPVELYLALLCASLLPVLITALLVGQLLIFHLMLQWQGLTTYEFLVREERRRQAREEQRAAHSEVRAMAAAGGTSMAGSVAARDDLEAGGTRRPAVTC